MFGQKYYYGEHKIVNSNKVTRDVGDVKDVEYIEVELDNGEKHLVLNRNAMAIIRKDKTDLTKLRENRCKRAIEEVAQILHEYNLLWNDYPFIVQNLNKVLEENERMATSHIWGKELNDLTFLDIFDEMDVKRSAERKERESIINQPPSPVPNSEPKDDNI